MDCRPNVLCISIDSLRADAVSFCLGSSPTSPFLDQLAREGTIYTGAISPSTWTLPVHTSVFTGLYPPEHGVLHRNVELGAHPTLAEQLRDEGYATQAYYRNGWLSVGGVLRGFDSRRRIDPDPTTATRIAGAIDSVLPGHGVAVGIRDALHGQTDDEATVDAAIRDLQSISKPFYAFVHLNDAHWPYAPPPEMRHETAGVGTIEAVRNRAIWQSTVLNQREQGWAGQLTLDDESLRVARNLYYGAIAHVDRQIERLIEALETAGALEETVIVVFGDHGDAFGEDGIFGHHFTVDDAVIRVPLLVVDPTNRLQTGTVDNPVNLNDLYPTLLELCGVDPPRTNSQSLLGAGTRDAAFCFYDYTEELAENANADLSAVPESMLPARKQYAAWAAPSNRTTWYPDSDQWESGDESLRRRLRQAVEQLEAVPNGGASSVSQDVLRNLADMGYIQE